MSKPDYEKEIMKKSVFDICIFNHIFTVIWQSGFELYIPRRDRIIQPFEHSIQVGGGSGFTRNT